ncbi:MAG: hypothetical protein ACE5KK_01045 [Candidatus Brocadiales bacterium]
MRRRFVALVVKAVFCTCVYYFVIPACSVLAASNPIYKDGDTYVELRDAKELKGASPPFSHPYIIQEDKLRKVLSSITYREKGVFVKKGGKKVFSKSEVEALPPLIVDALSKSTANEFLYVYSPRDRALLSNLETVFSAFVTGENLNMAFSRIQARVKKMPGNRKNSSAREPTSMKGSGFWELSLGEGQSYKEGHRNWLVINLQEKSFDVEPLVSRAEEKEEYDFYNNRTNPIIEDRLRRIEEQIGLGASTGSSPEIRTPAPREPEPAEQDNLSQKFRDLKELLDNDLISPEDYKYKKAELLKRESKTRKSIPQRLKDLRDLMDEALITEKDYEKKKRELLDRL